MESDIFSFRNPASGIEYNNLCDHPRVSGYLYMADVARNPRVVKDFCCGADVDLKVKEINSQRKKVESMAAKHFSRRM